MFGASHEIDEVFDLWRFAWGEILAKLCEISQTFGKISSFAFRETEKLACTTKLCNFVNIMFCIKHYLDKKKMNYRFI